MSVIQYIPPPSEPVFPVSGGFSWEIIPAGTKIVIPYGQQMLVVGNVTVEATGELDVEGSLIVFREDFTVTVENTTC
jgi:hypothetical protein